MPMLILAQMMVIMSFKETANTPFFRDFLSTHSLCLPATSKYHSGGTTTWTSPNGIDCHCIDHIAVPTGYLHDCTFSGVLNDFDLGTGMYDHSAVALQLEWRKRIPLPDLPVGRPKVQSRYDKACISAVHVQEALHSYASAPWQTDVESQVSSFNTQLFDGLARQCPRRASKPKKAYISEDVWHLRLCKLERRQALRDLRLRQRFEQLSICFATWVTTPQASQVDQFWAYDTWLLCCKVRLVGAF